MHRDDDIRARDDRRDDAGDRPLSREAAIEDERMAARRDVADDRAMRDDGEHRDNRGTGRAAAGGAAAGAGAMAGARAMRDDDRDTEHRRTTADDRTMRHERDTENRALRDRDIERDRVGDGDADPATRRHAPVLATEELATMRERQRDRFGGFQWGADFFGWLCAMGLASMLTAILVGAGVALGLSTTDATNAAADANSAQTIGLGGGIALLVVLAIAWFSGGYVAGRMARFDGARQGIGVWLWTILAAIIVAALAAIGGTEYDVFQRLNLPRIAIGGDTLTAGGAITGAVAIIVTLLFAVIGGKVGERFHKRVDRVATDEFVVDR
jgi:amino acid transporter